MRRVLVKLLFPLARVYWFIFRPNTFGVKCIIVCGDEMLMIRNSYGRGRWTFPGGGVEKGETNEQAILREVEEEVGITLTHVTELGSFLSTKEYKRDHVTAFCAEVNEKAFKIQESEIASAEWVKLSNFPQNAGDLATVCFGLYNNRQSG